MRPESGRISIVYWALLFCLKDAKITFLSVLPAFSPECSAPSFIKFSFEPIEPPSSLMSRMLPNMTSSWLPLFLTRCIFRVVSPLVFISVNFTTIVRLLLFFLNKSDDLRASENSLIKRPIIIGLSLYQSVSYIAKSSSFIPWILASE